MNLNDVVTFTSSSIHRYSRNYVNSFSPPWVPYVNVLDYKILTVAKNDAVLIEHWLGQQSKISTNIFRSGCVSVFQKMNLQLILHLIPFLLQLQLFKSSSSATQISFSRTSHEETSIEGASCNQKVYGDGTCTLIRNCPEYKKFIDAGIRPSFCGSVQDSVGLQPLVCCPLSIEQFGRQFPWIITIKDRDIFIQQKLESKTTRRPDSNYNNQNVHQNPFLNSEPVRKTKPIFRGHSGSSISQLDLIDEEISKVFGLNPQMKEIIGPPKRKPEILLEKVEPITPMGIVLSAGRPLINLSDLKPLENKESLYEKYIMKENMNDQLPFGKASRKMCKHYVNISHCPSVNFVIGGAPVKAKEYSHNAAIGFFDEKENEIKWRCGGAIISEQFILTAAHCLYNFEWGPATWVRLGDLNLKSDDDGSPRNYKIIEKIKHPSYKKSSYYHDIALLKVEETIEFNEYVRPTCLSMEEKAEESVKTATATGWGKVHADETDGSDVLMKVDLPLIDNENCTQYYENNIHLRSGIVPDYQMCAGTIGKDTCQGDSGGPLFIREYGTSCLHSIVGITSFGSFCGDKIPAVYIRIYNYISWIENTVWPEEVESFQQRRDQFKF